MIPKFRVWNKKTESFINYGDLMLDLKNGKVYAGDVGMPEYTIDVTKQVVLMQSTGLKDKNGVEIFEGDIVVAWSNGLEGTFVIKWRQEGSPSWILYPAWQNSEFWNLHGSLHSDGQHYDKGIEVIGNIYENPELLEVSN